MPQGIGFFVLALYENYVFVLLFQGFVQSFLLILIVNYRLLIPTESLLELFLPKPHFGVAIWQKVLQPLVLQLQVVEFSLLLLHQVGVVQGLHRDLVYVKLPG